MVHFFLKKIPTLPPYINVESGQVLLLSAQNFANNMKNFTENFFFEFFSTVLSKIEVYRLNTKIYWKLLEASSVSLQISKMGSFTTIVNNFLLYFEGLVSMSLALRICARIQPVKDNILIRYRSSYQRCSVKKVLLKIL